MKVKQAIGTAASVFFVTALATALIQTVIPSAVIDVDEPIDATTLWLSPQVSKWVHGSPAIEIGEDIVVRAFRTKSEYGETCVPVTSSRYATSVSTGDRTDLKVLVWQGGRASEAYVDLNFNTAVLPADSYRITTIASYPCPDRNEPFVYSSFFYLTVIPDAEAP